MKVFGHRGACGYLPENTIESFDLAFELGADAIEFDVVLTKDSQPVILHDSDLTKTTNVSETSLPRFVHELELEQLQTLKVVERFPERTQSARYSGQFSIPTLDQVLARYQDHHLIVEVKNAKLFASSGLDLISAVAQSLGKRVSKSGQRITLESFEFATLRALKSLVSVDGFVFLSEYDSLPAGFKILTDDLLEEIAANFDGVSVELKMLGDDNLVERAHKLGLIVFAYTARVETAEPDPETFFKQLISTGVDGVFADQPDRLLAVVGNTL